MRRRILLLGLIGAAPLLGAPNASGPSPTAVASAWLDLRQNAKEGAIQSAPAWVESITLMAGEKQPRTDGVSLITAARKNLTVFRIRVKKPDDGYNILFFRLFFNDRPDAQPEVTAWDSSRSQLLRFGPLGSGLELESSDSCMIPMDGVKNIDVEVPGDGANVRSAYLQWMTTNQVAQGNGAAADRAIAQPFSPALPLHAPAQDIEQFGTITATLSPDTIRIGSAVDEAAIFQFGVEAQPLLALLSFEIARPRVSAPPEIIVNGNNLGPATLILPELADPGYRGEMRTLMHAMDFDYTGWVRAQKVVPASTLTAGANTISVMNGAGAGSAAIRFTQIELKYLWDKSDYILKPAH
jgi:hypothetical protein